jgi:hypothetical protein
MKRKQKGQNEAPEMKMETTQVRETSIEVGRIFR